MLKHSEQQATSLEGNKTQGSLIFQPAPIEQRPFTSSNNNNGTWYGATARSGQLSTQRRTNNTKRSETYSSSQGFRSQSLKTNAQLLSQVFYKGQQVEYFSPA